MSPWKISVIILNYNGARWLHRCIESLQRQTIADQIEVIVADNASPDGSGQLCEELIRAIPNGRFHQNGENLGFCEGNNIPARLARGEYLFFLNNDTWLEPDCLEKLWQGVLRTDTDSATPLVMDYDSNETQWMFAYGIDLFGLPTFHWPKLIDQEFFMPPGCSYLIRREVFEKLGGFDPEIFMYADEFDLSWRLWISGGKAVLIPSSRLHHRGSAHVNPVGGEKVIEFRTSAMKRYYTNRNCLIALFKNAHSWLLFASLLQIFLLLIESFAALLLIRNWTFVRKAYLEALRDCWRLRHHILAQRKILRPLRKHGDFWFAARFLRFKPNRWDELLRVLKQGPPET